ncbi:hypothetical protein [Gymnodinialimonas hymeniacidonis]|uniref:hypothetical protein n=1 Tax=Gymnodinialimonas hymeniacidonis TaxID=3126508 RepID=UPI0034C64074
MSPSPTRKTTPEALLGRADRYVRRAETLSASPHLTQDEARGALEHLAQMQEALAKERRLAESSTMPLRSAEQRLLAARSELSEAMLHAHPSDTHIGLVPHGPAEIGDMALQPASICRSMVDLEALRPFLSDAALEDAIVRRSRATGRADVTGVAYAALPESAHLVCTLL